MATQGNPAGPGPVPGGAADVDVRSLEERAFNAWPALQTVLIDGWVLRFSQGYTKRANSVNAWAPAISTDAILELARPLYAAQRLPLVFRLSPLAASETDLLLAGKGFKCVDETIVMTASIDAGMAVDPAVRIAATLEPDWVHGIAAPNRVPSVHRRTHDQMLASIRFPMGLATLDRDGTAGAWGVAVVERGMVGLFDIVTASEARRQGLARRLVMSLMAWGRGQAASQAYLQVGASNAPAISLYQRFGFREVYRYHYRVAAD